MLGQALCMEKLLALVRWCDVAVCQDEIICSEISNRGHERWYSDRQDNSVRLQLIRCKEYLNAALKKTCNCDVVLILPMCNWLT